MCIDLVFLFFIGKLIFFFPVQDYTEKMDFQSMDSDGKYWRLLNWRSLAGRHLWHEVSTCRLWFSVQNFLARATFEGSCPTLRIKMMIYRELQSLFQLVAPNFLCVTEHFLNVCLTSSGRFSFEGSPAVLGSNLKCWLWDSISPVVTETTST